MYQLIIENGSREGERFRPSGGEVTVGRDKNNTLRLVDDGVSQQHCAVRITRRGVMVRDLNSTNGIYVNDDRVEGETRLASGDCIEVGVVRLRFEFLHGAPSNKRRINLLFWASVVAVAITFSVEFAAVGLAVYTRTHRFTQAEMNDIINFFPPIPQEQLPDALAQPVPAAKTKAP